MDGDHLHEEAPMQSIALHEGGSGQEAGGSWPKLYIMASPRLMVYTMTQNLDVNDIVFSQPGAPLT